MAVIDELNVLLKLPDIDKPIDEAMNRTAYQNIFGDEGKTHISATHIQNYFIKSVQVLNYLITNYQGNDKDELIKKFSSTIRNISQYSQ